MKNEFANLMLKKNFRGAAKLIYDATLKVKIPKNVNVKINIDREQNIAETTEQMKKCYDEIYKLYEQISFDHLWKSILSRAEFSEKQNLKSNDIVLKNAHIIYDKAIEEIKIKQFEQLFETVTSTSNAVLQGVINAARKAQR